MSESRVGASRSSIGEPGHHAIIKEFASYPKYGKKSLMQTGNISLINIFSLFLNKN